jgi:hypothetical protein
MLKQRGWAGLLPIGLIAIAATGGVIVASEQISGTDKPVLSNLLTGKTQAREGKVSVEFLEGKPAPVAPAPEAPTK